MKMETKVNPNKLTKVANTPGSYLKVNCYATSKKITITMAPTHKVPIKIPFIINDSFIFFGVVNSPESSNS